MITDTYSLLSEEDDRSDSRKCLRAPGPGKSRDYQETKV